MQPNPNGPNPSLDNFSKTVEGGVNTLSNINLDLASGEAGRFLAGRLVLLKTLVNDLDNPILKGLGTEMLSVMSQWFYEPETLCCLIQGIWAAYNDGNKNNKLKAANTTSLSIADTSFGDFLDSLISFLDLIIVFLTQDLRKLVTFIPDFIKEIFGTIMGAILLVIQETLFALKDSVINVIVDWINDKAKVDNIWARCLPMQKLIDLIKKYTQDYGLLAELNEKIKGYVSGLIGSWGMLKNKELIMNANDIEYLFWLRNVLIKLKQAVINFDLCVEYDYHSNDIAVAINDTSTKTVSKINDILTTTTPNENISDAENNNILSLEDGTIVVNNESSSNKSDESKNNWRSRISKDSIIDFGINYLGYPREVLENAYTKATSNDQGSVLSPNSDIQDKCPGFTKAAQILGFRRGL